MTADLPAWERIISQLSASLSKADAEIARLRAALSKIEAMTHQRWAADVARAALGKHEST